jgi:hypothetical protein
MDYKVLKKLLQKENLEPKELWQFFGIDSQKKMEELLVANLNDLKDGMDDGMVYIGPSMIYESSIENDHNIFYEKMMVISYFLKSFAKYDSMMIEAFIKAVGMMRFVYLGEKTLKTNDLFIFFKESFQEYKKDKYFREQTDRMVKMFDDITSDIEALDLTEVKQLAEEMKKHT